MLTEAQLALDSERYFKCVLRIDLRSYVRPKCSFLNGGNPGRRDNFNNIFFDKFNY